MTTPDEQEQRLPTGDDDGPSVAPDLPSEASEADVLEQARVVPLDEDERPA